VKLRQGELAVGTGRTIQSCRFSFEVSAALVPPTQVQDQCGLDPIGYLGVWSLVPKLVSFRRCGRRVSMVDKVRRLCEEERHNIAPAQSLERRVSAPRMFPPLFLIAGEAI
jgi:hypothetical protein